MACSTIDLLSTLFYTIHASMMKNSHFLDPNMEIWWYLFKDFIQVHISYKNPHTQENNSLKWYLSQ